MNIVVDIGNTRTKIALFEKGDIQIVEAFLNAESPSEKIILAASKAKQGIISNVSRAEVDWKENFIGVEWIHFSHEINLPFINKYDTPATLGLDRMALAAAAQLFYPKQNVLVIDAGTCVTFDFIDVKGRYRGGSISPGLQMRLQAMHHFTAKLPLARLLPSNSLIGKSTESSLASGALNGLAAEIDGISHRYEKRFENLIIVLTGGDTKVLVPLVKSGIFADQNFLLQGLHAILAYNTP